MAWENYGPVITLPASTGLTQFRFVTVNTSGNLSKPTGLAGTGVLGVLVSSGTTGSTSDSQVGAVQIAGICKVSAPSSTVSVGDWVATSTAGQAIAATTALSKIGLVVDGSSGGASRILSVALIPIGTT